MPAAAFGRPQILDLGDKDWTAAIIKTLQELEDTRNAERIESMMMSHRIENINEETEVTKKEQIEFLVFKSTITKIKNSLKGPNRKSAWKKEPANLHTDQQSMQSKEQREERRKRSRTSEKSRTPSSAPTYMSHYGSPRRTGEKGAERYPKK